MKNGDLIQHRYFGGRGGGRSVFRDDRECGRLNCHVLVKKERFEQQWPTDLEFRKFAARLADAAQKALHEGKRVAPKSLGGQCCPLGCLPEMRDVCRFPDYEYAPRNETYMWRAFYNGFDGETDIGLNSPYYRLGQEYRKRFTGEKST